MSVTLAIFIVSVGATQYDATIRIVLTVSSCALRKTDREIIVILACHLVQRISFVRQRETDAHLSDLTYTLLLVPSESISIVFILQNHYEFPKR